MSYLLLPREGGANFLPFIPNLAKREERNGKRAVGFDVKMAQSRLIGYFNHYVQASGCGILHMYRKNTLATIVSAETMAARMKRGLPPHGTTRADNKPVYLDPEWLKLRVEDYELQDRIAAFTHSLQPYIQVCYEDFMTPDGWQVTCKRLFGFFHLDLRCRLARPWQSRTLPTWQNSSSTPRKYSVCIPGFSESSRPPNFRDAGGSVSGDSVMNSRNRRHTRHWRSSKPICSRRYATDAPHRINRPPGHPATRADSKRAACNPRAWALQTAPPPGARA